MNYRLRSRKGKIRKYANKMIVFLVSGLWHGASLAFVVWGGLNGIYQVIGEETKPIRDKIVSVMRLNRESLAHRMMQIVVTFILVDFSWIFFRASSLKQSFEIIKSMFTLDNAWIIFDGSLYQILDSKNFWLLLICICILVFADYCKHKGIKIREVIIKQDYWFRWIFIAFVVSAILIFGIWGPAYNAANFIYFQF